MSAFYTEKYVHQTPGPEIVTRWEVAWEGSTHLVTHFSLAFFDVQVPDHMPTQDRISPVLWSPLWGACSPGSAPMIQRVRAHTKYTSNRIYIRIGNECSMTDTQKCHPTRRRDLESEDPDHEIDVGVTHEATVEETGLKAAFE